jgi:DNA-directed RNA polymerase specialized sigma24 family protein
MLRHVAYPTRLVPVERQLVQLVDIGGYSNLACAERLNCNDDRVEVVWNRRR